MNKSINKINRITTDGNYSYDEVVNNTRNNKDCQKHVISKSETCLVESYNSSVRDTFARFRKRIKRYSKSIEMIYYNSILE